MLLRLTLNAVPTCGFPWSTCGRTGRGTGSRALLSGSRRWHPCSRFTGRRGPRISPGCGGRRPRRSIWGSSPGWNVITSGRGLDGAPGGGMSGPAGAEGIRAGDRVIIDGRPQVVLSASGTAIRFARDDGVIEDAAVAGLAGSGRLQLGRTGGRPVPQAGLARVPPGLVERGKGGQRQLSTPSRTAWTNSPTNPDRKGGV